MADPSNQVKITKVPLPGDILDQSLLQAFASLEAENLQLGLDWLQNLAQFALDESESAVLFVARLAPDNFVALPMRIEASKHRIFSLSTFYSSLYSPLVNSDTPQVLFRALFAHLATVEQISEVSLSPMDVNSTHFAQVLKAQREAGWRGVHSYFCFGNWAHRFPESLTVNEGSREQVYQSYMASRPSKLRNTLRRKMQKFVASDRGMLKVIQGVDEVEEGLRHYHTVYQRSWKREEPYPEFVPALLRLAARRGWLRLGIASFDGEPVASQIWLVWQGKALIFKLAYDENLKHLSPGSLLTSHMMAHVIIEDEVSTLDYLSGDDTYKKDWMSVRRERHGITAYNPRTLRGLGMFLFHSLKTVLKTFRG